MSTTFSLALDSTVEMLAVTQNAAWAPWAVCYFFFIGLSIFCFFLSLPGVLRHEAKKQGIVRPALIGALSCGIVAPIALLADLHHPGRFMNFYLSPQASSWMALGAFCIPVYVFSLMVYGWAAFRPLLLNDPNPTLPPWIHRLLSGKSIPALTITAATTAMVSALIILLYTGMETAAVEARAAWNSPMIPILLVMSGAISAPGLLLIISAKDPDANRFFRRTLLMGLLVLSVGYALWALLGIMQISDNQAQALRAVLSPAWRMSLIVLFATLALPILLLVARIQGRLTDMLIGTSALAQAWLLRWTILIDGQNIPKVGAGMYSPSLALGGDGLLGIIGVFGLWIFVFIVLTTLFPLTRLDAKTVYQA